MVFELKGFHTFARFVLGNKAESGLFELVNLVRVHLVAMAVAFVEGLAAPIESTELAPVGIWLESRRT